MKVATDEEVERWSSLQLSPDGAWVKLLNRVRQDAVRLRAWRALALAGATPCQVKKRAAAVRAEVTEWIRSQ